MFACGSKTEPNKSAPAGSASQTTEGSASTVKARDGKIDVAPTARPTAEPAPPAPDTAGQAFAAQRRDDAWAKGTEADIKHRFATGVRAGHLDATECRTDQCLLTISGTEEEMGRALADLETEGGLRNFADHIILDGPETRDGTMIVKAYAVFDRKTER